jgi:hypothetical protein
LREFKEAYLLASISKREEHPYFIALGYRSTAHPGFDVFAATNAFTEHKNTLFLIDDGKIKMAKVECIVE